MKTTTIIPRLCVRRTTAETSFEIRIGPRDRRTPALSLPNRMLSHLLDHFAKASGLAIELGETEWPGSWPFDHVLCEDMGQLIGRGVGAVRDALAAETGVPGRAEATVCMDEAEVRVVLSFESRPRVDWRVPIECRIDGFVDAWYGPDGSQAGWCAGTNLRQFIDGFAYGSGATITVSVARGDNLHHLYECLFRACGDAVRDALGWTSCDRLPGDTSGLAGPPEYTVRRMDEC